MSKLKCDMNGGVCVYGDAASGCGSESDLQRRLFRRLIQPVAEPCTTRTMRIEPFD